MKPEIAELIGISRYYGINKDFVIAGGGNTSFKDDKSIWIKASGISLANLSEEGLVVLSRDKLHSISVKKYSDDPVLREEEVKIDLSESIVGTDITRRPSVETSLHELINFRYVVHLHPAAINGMLCSRSAKSLTLKLFGDKVLFIPYTDPGYTLFKKLETEIVTYRQKFYQDPRVIFLENHGTFVSGDSTDEIRKTYENIISVIEGQLFPHLEITPLPPNNILTRVVPAIRMIMTDDKPPVIRYRHNSLIAGYYQNHQEFHRISLPLTPDIIVYCKSRYMFIEHSATPDKILESLKMQLPRFRNEYGFDPKVIVIKNVGILAIEDSASAAETVLDIYEDLIKLCHYSALAGGTKFLTPEQVEFIDKWEVENYRRKVGISDGHGNKLKNKIAVITGGAQGFGAGIAEALFRMSVNVVVADLNEETGTKLVSDLSGLKCFSKAVFVRTDVSDPVSVRNLIELTVSEFGGIDLLISNAGILKAGGLDEMDPEAFTLTTGVNYNGYFNCAKYASAVMKLQNAEKPDYFTDIIQINSKSGLRGSNRNFAYAGSKFGGIGLTQSFALELAPYRIKVNAICPGNYYEGPLWSDPGNGLFIQYLRTGKVPGAKSIEDVRRFYEEQVPMKRGCRLEDIMKALMYIVDQEYETGQAVPVTGGQVMLG